jgi:hypothetical protein
MMKTHVMTDERYPSTWAYNTGAHYLVADIDAQLVYDLQRAWELVEAAEKAVLEAADNYWDNNPKGRIK